MGHSYQILICLIICNKFHIDLYTEPFLPSSSSYEITSTAWTNSLSFLQIKQPRNLQHAIFKTFQGASLLHLFFSSNHLLVPAFSQL